jgi:hypothetical protein
VQAYNLKFHPATLSLLTMKKLQTFAEKVQLSFQEARECLKPRNLWVPKTSLLSQENTRNFL